MKKTFALFGLLLVILSFGVTATPPMLVEPYPQFGSGQYYTVIFDGEGEAAVAAKIMITNHGINNLSFISLEIPGEHVRLIQGVQEVFPMEKSCVNWQNICNDNDLDDGRCDSYYYQCIDWQVSRGYKPLYYPLEQERLILSKSVQYTFSLAKPVEPQQSATLLLYYKATGYVSESLGTFDFDFETIKYGGDIDTVRVAVSVQDDLYLKGEGSTVDYRSNFGVMEAAASMDKGVANAELQGFSQRIMYSNGYVRQTQRLDPWESFHVTGTYASNWLALHKGVSLVVLLFILGMVYGGIFTVKKLRQIKAKKSVVMLGTGFIGSATLIVFWFLVLWLIDNVSYWMDYQYTGLIMPLLVLVAILGIVSLLFGPSVYIGFRYRALSGLFTFGITIGFLFVYAILLVIILAVGTSPW